MMKIAQLIRPVSGGMRRHFVLLLKNLASKHQITAYISDDNFLKRELKDAGIAYEIIPFPSQGTARDYFCLSSLLANKWKGKGFSLFHFHGYRAAVVGSLAIKKLKEGLAVATIHNFPPPGLVNKFFFWVSKKIIVTSCQRLIFVSKAVKKSWRIRGEASKALVIYNGLSEDFLESDFLIRPIEINKEKKIKVAFIGRLSREKGADIFLKAAQVLKDELQLDFLIVGEGEEKENLVKLCSELGLRWKVDFLKFQPDLKLFLKEVDLVVIPSRQEAFSLLAIEALSFGKPVIASQVGGLPEALGPFGYFFSAEDFVSLAGKIKEAVGSLSSFPGAEAAQWVQKKFPLSKMVNQVEEVYQKVVEESAKKSL